MTPRTTPRRECGTRAQYHAGCRCTPCREANRAYENNRYRQRGYGRTAYVDAEPVRQHVQALQASGLGRRRIAALAKVPHGSLSKLLYGDADRGLAPSKRVRPDTAARLLAVQACPENIAEHQLVEPIGTHRRLQALMTLGWSGAKLAAQLGMDTSNLWHTMAARHVHASTARAVRVLHERLWDTPPPEQDHRDKIAAARARNHARSQGWAPTLAWDDIDDPAEIPSHQIPDSGQPDEVVVEQLVAGRRASRRALPVERAEAARRMFAGGLTVTEISTRLRISGARVRVLLADKANHCVHPGPMDGAA